MKNKSASRLVRRGFSEDRSAPARRTRWLAVVFGRRRLGANGFFDRRALVTLLFCGAACSILIPTLSGLGFSRPEGVAKVSQRTLTFAERVAYQRAIEEVYWRHRIWPRDRGERPDPKPSLDAVMCEAQLENKVADYMGKSQELEDYWQRPLTTEQLQAEMDRMARHTKQLDVLRELFEALGNDPFIIAECLARPVLSNSLVTDFYTHDQRLHGQLKRRAESWQTTAETQAQNVTASARANYSLPTISGGAGCTDDTWTAMSITKAPAGRNSQTAVWTGSEMIVWGGYGGSYLNTGGRYNPSTDSWAAISAINAPTARGGHTAVWTGSEMIVWGGDDGQSLNTGGRYNPATDTWTATSTTNAPLGRIFHTVVWTGSEMVVWGGWNEIELRTGGRYDPSTDSWTATSLTNAPAARFNHTGVWTGSEMIVWGGWNGSNYFSAGGRYNSNTDSWTATSTINAPTSRYYHTAVWTGSEMIVWGGRNGANYFSTGGKYNPGTDSWTATSTAMAPTGRYYHTAVWTGSEMIVWGGWNGGNYFDTGARYNPSTDSWTAITATNAPTGRYGHTAVWTGSEMIAWGGYDGSYLNSGGRYCAQSASPTPTPTPTPTATPQPSPTPRSSLAPRTRPTPAPRP